MFQHALGDATWAKGLRYYLTQRSFNYGTPDHLYEGLQESVNEDSPPGTVINVATIMKSWELQSGFPYITVSRTGNQLTFTQNRFLYSDRTSTNLWWVPINYVVGSNPDFTVTTPDLWLQGVATTTIQSTSAAKPFTVDDWIVVNIQESGYYRVNYDNLLWGAIVQQLGSSNDGFEQIHVLNRAQLIDDSLSFARAGLLNYNVNLAILNYLERETDYIPWAAASRGNSLLNRWITGTTAHSRYQAFMRKNVEPLYLRLGTNIIENEPRVDRYARSIAINIACQAQHEVCLTQTHQQLVDMLSSGNALAADLTAPIYCNGIRSASEATYSAMLTKLTNSKVQLERNTIISGLGCTHNMTLLRNFFNIAVLPTAFSLSERSRILTSAVNIGEESIQTMIDFLSINSGVVNAYGLVQTIASNIAARIHTQALLNDFISLLNALGTSGYLTEAQISSHLSTASTIISWQAGNVQTFISYFYFLDSQETTVPTPAPTTPAPTTPTPTTAGPTDETTTDGATSKLLSALVLGFSIALKFMM